jgi:hypothetical protein
MSVKHRNYVMFGVIRRHKFKDRSEVYEALEGLTDEGNGLPDPRELCILWDGMGAGYVAMGFIYAKSREFEGFSDIVTIPETTPELVAACVEKVLLALPQQDGEPPLEFKWHVISHYY